MKHPVMITSAIRLAAAAIDKVIEDRLKDYDLTHRQLLVLLALKDQPSAIATHLVDEIGIDRSTMADLLRRIQKKGLITRRRDKADGRALRLEITPAGHAIVPIGRKVLADVEREIGIGPQVMIWLRAIIAMADPKVTHG